MVQLQSSLSKIEDTGTQLVAISYDSPRLLKAFAEQSGIKYLLLSDTDSKTISAFGVKNDQARGRQAGIPHPGTFLVGQDGQIKAKLPGTVRVRHSGADLLKLLNH